MLVLGGRKGAKILTTVEKYDINGNRVATLNNMGTAR